MVRGWLKEKGHYYYLEDGKMLVNTTVTLDGRSFSFNEYGVCTSDTQNLSFTEANAQNVQPANNSSNTNTQGPGAAGPGAAGPGAAGPGAALPGTTVNPNGDTPSSNDGPSSQGPSGSSGSTGSTTIQEGSTNGPR